MLYLRQKKGGRWIQSLAAFKHKSLRPGLFSEMYLCLGSISLFLLLYFLDDHWLASSSPTPESCLRSWDVCWRFICDPPTAMASKRGVWGGLSCKVCSWIWTFPKFAVIQIWGFGLGGWAHQCFFHCFDILQLELVGNFPLKQFSQKMLAHQSWFFLWKQAGFDKLSLIFGQESIGTLSAQFQQNPISSLADFLAALSCRLPWSHELQASRVNNSRAASTGAWKGWEPRL